LFRSTTVATELESGLCDSRGGLSTKGGFRHGDSGSGTGAETEAGLSVGTRSTVAGTSPATLIGGDFIASLSVDPGVERLMTLLELVERARDRLVVDKEIRIWHEGRHPDPVLVRPAAAEAAADILRLCFGGHYRLAATSAFFLDWFINELFWTDLEYLDD